MSPSPRALALALLLAALAAAPVRAGDVEAEAAVARARAAAAEGRHREAAREFSLAIREAPERRFEWLRELADQLAWGGRAEKAVPRYEELLAGGGLAPADERAARHGLALALSWSGRQERALAEYERLLAEDPDDLDARLGRARVLSWLDENGPARRAYEDVLRTEPGNLDARRSLGRVQSWRGRHRDAARRLEALLAEHPEDSESVVLLAQTQDWMGRPDRAQATLRAHLASHPADGRARALLDEIESRTRPEFRFDWQESHQSDQLRIRTLSVAQDLHLNDGRTTVGPRFQSQRYNPDRGGDVQVHRPGVHARHRLTDDLEWNGDLWVDVIDAQGPFVEKFGPVIVRRDGRDHTTLTYDTWLTWWANDLLRFDVGSNRTTFDNVESLHRLVTATYGTFSVDVTPDEKTRATARFRWGDFSDGNEQGWWQLEAERRLRSHPRLSGGLRYTGFDFSEQLDNGYFNPDSYHSFEALFRAYDQLAKGLWWNVEASAGFETATPEDDNFIWGAGGGLSYWLTDSLELALRYHFYSSATGSSGGFERGTGGLSLRWRW